MTDNVKINYIELPASNLDATKRFFTDAFGWTFTDYGPEYTAFSNSGIEGGFFLSPLTASTQTGSALVVLYSADLESTQAKVKENGGEIIKPIFSFPGGRRFHFADPNGNEFAVWSDK
jgi:uncharacterized protein